MTNTDVNTISIIAIPTAFMAVFCFIPQNALYGQTIVEK